MKSKLVKIYGNDLLPIPGRLPVRETPIGSGRITGWLSSPSLALLVDLTASYLKVVYEDWMGWIYLGDILEVYELDISGQANRMEFHDCAQKEESKTS